MHFLSPDLIRREVSCILAGTFSGDAYLDHMDRVEVTMLDSVDVMIDGEQMATADLANLQTPLQDFSKNVLVPAIYRLYMQGRFGLDAVRNNALFYELWKGAQRRE